MQRSGSRVDSQNPREHAVPCPFGVAVLKCTKATKAMQGF